MTHPLLVADCGHYSSARGQLSRDNLLDGRGRSVASARRAHIHGGIDRDAFMRRWSLLMIASFSSREHCAVHFGVTFQTACNWFDGLCRPYGDAVDFAARTLPEYDRVMRG